MTATPLPVPPAPAGPPASGTFGSSTPTPQQLAGTESEGSHARFVAPEKFSLPAKVALGFLAGSRFPSPLPLRRRVHRGNPGLPGRVFSRAKRSTPSAQVSPKFRYVTAYVYPRARI